MLQSMVHKPSRLVVKLFQILYQALCSLFFCFACRDDKLNPLLAKWGQNADELIQPELKEA